MIDTLMTTSHKEQDDYVGLTSARCECCTFSMQNSAELEK